MTRGGRGEALIEWICGEVVGDDAVVDGPFGPRRMVYADATASGRSLAFIEDLIREQVLPTYANTHTEASATGRRTTELREQARRIVHRAVNGGADDAVVFCGSGATGAIDKLIRALALDRGPRPVVFIGPYEHHSNELPWRESPTDVVPIAADGDGRIDLEHLEHQLRRHAHRPRKIGSFSAASNVTGVITDVDRVAIALHRHGALSCWDYAAAGPYLPIDINAAYKDAVFLSPHKFPGGPGTPGVLVAKRALLRRAVPTVPGGGTILFVSPSAESYHPDAEVREEGGTPAIVESIRAGLAFALKEAVGADAILRREHDRQARVHPAELPVSRQRGGLRLRPRRVHLIADQGWKLLPLYRFDPYTAIWEHRAAGLNAPAGLRAMLDAAPPPFARAPDSVLAGQLDAARRIIDAAGAQPPASLPSQPSRSAEFERIRWFPLPSEALERLRSVNRPRAA
jgi:selenocysteine lyase/cysteine desulfurase